MLRTTCLLCAMALQLDARETACCKEAGSATVSSSRTVTAQYSRRQEAVGPQRRCEPRCFRLTSGCRAVPGPNDCHVVDPGGRFFFSWAAVDCSACRFLSSWPLTDSIRWAGRGKGPCRGPLDPLFHAERPLHHVPVTAVQPPNDRPPLPSLLPQMPAQRSTTVSLNLHRCSSLGSLFHRGNRRQRPGSKFDELQNPSSDPHDPGPAGHLHAPYIPVPQGTPLPPCLFGIPRPPPPPPSPHHSLSTLYFPDLNNEPLPLFLFDHHRARSFLANHPLPATTSSRPEPPRTIIEKAPESQARKAHSSCTCRPPANPNSTRCIRIRTPSFVFPAPSPSQSQRQPVSSRLVSSFSSGQLQDPRQKIPSARDSCRLPAAAVRIDSVRLRIRHAVVVVVVVVVVVE
ncbi:uncharacterized protein IWZ02DRAFT_148344 [Phyllosticta citriasiana]|uniref:uncharacterized protein n=1 Tax=Phyllosticta citriasiana TaxID=595635 RepID=UPI0030FD6959